MIFHEAPVAPEKEKITSRSRFTTLSTRNAAACAQDTICSHVLNIYVHKVNVKRDSTSNVLYQRFSRCHGIFKTPSRPTAHSSIRSRSVSTITVCLPCVSGHISKTSCVKIMAVPGSSPHFSIKSLK